MSAHLRKGLYGLILAIVAALSAYGLLDGPQAVAVGQVAALALGALYAALNASGSRLLDPATRRALYLLIAGAGVVPLAWGIAPSAVTLWINLALAAVSALLAIWNVDPDEVVQTVPGEVLPDETVTIDGPGQPDTSVASAYLVDLNRRTEDARLGAVVRALLEQSRDA